MIDWQPIETAPRDLGKPLLLFWPSYSYEWTDGPIDNPVIDIGWWTVNGRLTDRYGDMRLGTVSDERRAQLAAKNVHTGAYFTNTDELDCYGQAQDHNAPTHWMPLPGPPTEVVAKGEVA